MDALYRCCAGLDIHKDTVVACVRRLDEHGHVSEEIRTFGTMTAALLSLADWLAEQGVTHAAMESTGVYWKPVYHVLEGQFELLLVNAQHINKCRAARRTSRTVPGSRSCFSTACSKQAWCRRPSSGSCVI
jgi:transposase